MASSTGKLCHVRTCDFKQLCWLLRGSRRPWHLHLTNAQLSSSRWCLVCLMARDYVPTVKCGQPFFMSRVTLWKKKVDFGTFCLKKKIIFFHPGRKKDLQPARFIMYRIHRIIQDAGWWIESHVPYFTSGHSDFPTFYSLITVKNFSVITTTLYLFCILLFPFFFSASSNLVCCIISPPPAAVLMPIMFSFIFLAWSFSLVYWSRDC